MKFILSLFSLLLFVAPSVARADSAAVYWGTMNTELLGKGKLVGGAYEMSLLPLISLQLRAGYAKNFDEFNIKPPSTDGLNEYQIALHNAIFGNLESTTRAQLKDFTVIPLEIGVVGHTSVLGFLGVYAGVGYGYYIVPGFTVTSRSGIDYAKNIDDVSGWWGLIGIEGGMPNLKLFAEVKYSRIRERDVDLELDYMGYTGKLNANIDLSGISYVLGVRLCW